MSTRRAQVVAYAIVAFIAAFALFQANQAIDLARDVDYRGDIRSCQQENLINIQSNARNETLEQTAYLMRKSLVILRNADRERGEMTNKRLAEVAAEAKLLPTNFQSALILDCSKEVPAP